MARKLLALAFVTLLSTYLCGCVALLAGAAGGAGTAVWLSGKLSTEVSYSFDRTLEATRAGIKSLGLTATKETIKKEVAQVISSYTDGKTIWVDIRRIAAARSRIDVRVGAVGDKEAAQRVLDTIVKYL